MAIYRTTIVEHKQIAENTVEVSFKRPGNFSFRAGQYIQLGMPKLLYLDYKGTSRVFSICSSPNDRGKISIAFRDSGSGFKQTLLESPIGTGVIIKGPFGFFTFPKNFFRPLIFIAGGIGITPYLSMVRYVAQERIKIFMTLLYANRNKESAAYLEELQDTTKKNPYFVLKNKFGKIDEQFIGQNVKNMQQCIWHIAGPPAMVDSIRNLLFLLSIDEGKIYFEEFLGYE